MDFNNLYRSYQIQAAEVVLTPDEAYMYRKMCRWYSEKFHTPLLTVESLPIDHILTTYYESTMEQIPYNDLYDLIIEDFLPEIQEVKDKEDEEFAKALEEEQAQQLAAKALKSGKTNKKTVQKKETIENLPDSTPDINIKFDDDI
jgi:hypothetical protein